MQPCVDRCAYHSLFDRALAIVSHLEEPSPVLMRSSRVCMAAGAPVEGPAPGRLVLRGPPALALPPGGRAAHGLQGPRGLDAPRRVEVDRMGTSNKDMLDRPPKPPHKIVDRPPKPPQKIVGRPPSCHSIVPTLLLNLLSVFVCVQDGDNIPEDGIFPNPPPPPPQHAPALPPPPAAPQDQSGHGAASASGGGTEEERGALDIGNTRTAGNSTHPYASYSIMPHSYHETQGKMQDEALHDLIVCIGAVLQSRVTRATSRPVLARVACSKQAVRILIRYQAHRNP
jgi:hypothetical protein